MSEPSSQIRHFLIRCVAIIFVVRTIVSSRSASNDLNGPLNDREMAECSRSPPLENPGPTNTEQVLSEASIIAIFRFE